MLMTTENETDKVAQAKKRRAEKKYLGEEMTGVEILTLKLVAAGKRYKEIADMLHIKETTVKQRIYLVKKKLGARSVPGIIVVAFKKGILKHEQ